MSAPRISQLLLSASGHPQKRGEEEEIGKLWYQPWDICGLEGGQYVDLEYPRPHYHHFDQGNWCNIQERGLGQGSTREWWLTFPIPEDIFGPLEPDLQFKWKQLIPVLSSLDSYLLILPGPWAALGARLGVERKEGKKVSVVQSVSGKECLTLCDPMDCNPSGSSVHGIFLAGILEWVAMPSSRGSSDLCSIHKLIFCPRASHLAPVKMLKLQFDPRWVQRLPSGAHLPISEPPLWVNWCRRNSRLMLGVWTSKTRHGAGYSDFFPLGSGSLSMRQYSLLWWSESLAQWPSVSSPSVSQSQTRMGICGWWHPSIDSLFASAKNQHEWSGFFSCQNKQRSLL